ncbi:hypothetical protein PFISCL1PPCAC_16266, partial [Pristionchus fissidentatus]
HVRAHSHARVAVVDARIDDGYSIPSLYEEDLVSSIMTAGHYSFQPSTTHSLHQNHVEHVQNIHDDYWWKIFACTNRYNSLQYQLQYLCLSLSRILLIVSSPFLLSFSNWEIIEGNASNSFMMERTRRSRTSSTVKSIVDGIDTVVGVCS